jgi:hypothetical protein
LSSPKEERLQFFSGFFLGFLPKTIWAVDTNVDNPTFIERPIDCS